MTAHYDEEAQAEQLRDWWKENWMALLAGLVIGLGGIFGWQGWQNHRHTHAAEASQMFEELGRVFQDGRDDMAPALVERLVKDFADTPYAAAAQLRVAAQDVQAANYDAALERLRWVQDKVDDDGLRMVAKLRIARVLWQQGKADEALKNLDGVTGSFAPLAQELRGDIRLAQGDADAARAAYEKALTETPEDQPSRGLLQRKLDDLAPAVQS